MLPSFVCTHMCGHLVAVCARASQAASSQLLRVGSCGMGATVASAVFPHSSLCESQQPPITIRSNPPLVASVFRDLLWRGLECSGRLRTQTACEEAGGGVSADPPFSTADKMDAGGGGGIVNAVFHDLTAVPAQAFEGVRHSSLLMLVAREPHSLRSFAVCVRAGC